MALPTARSSTQSPSTKIHRTLALPATHCALVASSPTLVIASSPLPSLQLHWAAAGCGYSANGARSALLPRTGTPRLGYYAIQADFFCSSAAPGESIRFVTIMYSYNIRDTRQCPGGNCRLFASVAACRPSGAWFDALTSLLYTTLGRYSRARQPLLQATVAAMTPYYRANKPY